MFYRFVRRKSSAVVLGLMLFAFAGCDAPAFTAPEAPPAAAPTDNLSLGLGIKLPLNGLLAPLSCLIPDTVGVTIGPAGGTITLGASSLVIPAHALTQSVHILMLPGLGSSVAVQFFPEGLVFAKDANPTLTLNTDCIGNPVNDYIVYTDLFGNVKERLTTISRTPHSVSAKIAHFSRYAVAW